jgi:hypothetical protein
MRKLGIAALAIGTIVSFVGAAQATTSNPGPGLLCNLLDRVDPTTGSASSRVGTLSGGPLVLLDDAGSPTGGTLVCTVQVGGSGLHTDADAASASANGNAVVVLGPTLVAYETDGEPVYLCTSFQPNDGGPTLYYNNSNDPTVEGSFTVDPGSSCALAASLDPAPVFSPPRYTNPGATVVRGNGATPADSGFAICQPALGTGTGGLCLPFGDDDAVQVVDDTAGENVAFQVCIDNNGDGFCTFGESGPCADDIEFSHDDAGNFFNPVGPLRTGFRTGCPGGPWNGYVVIICNGVHVTASPHAHPATTGTASVTSGGEGLGTFCGNPRPDGAKPYFVLR